jgi:hypothetical protein
MGGAPLDPPLEPPDDPPDELPLDPLLDPPLDPPELELLFEVVQSHPEERHSHAVGP